MSVIKKLIVANWKMNFGPHEASLYLHKLSAKIPSAKKVEIVLCPPAVDLFPLARDLDKTKFKLGAQNMHALDHGPYTGEISGAMLKGLAHYVIIGHSERRQHFGEKDKDVAAKLAAALRHHLKPILCVGDTLVEREHRTSGRVVVDQVTTALANLTAEEVERVVIAYEPVWAIGSGHHLGEFAKPGEVEPMVELIKNTVEDLYGARSAKNLQILYGGSVAPDNTAGYLGLKHIDGLLVGTSSLHHETFAAIVAAAERLK